MPVLCALLTGVGYRAQNPVTQQLETGWNPLRFVEVMAILTLLPCLDTDEMAAARKHELRIPRNVAAELGQLAAEAAKAGYYTDPHGRRVD